jgi:hypothetical protein
MKRKTQRKLREIKYDPREWDDAKSLEVEPEKRSGAEVSTSIRLPKSMVSKLRRVAIRKGGIGHQTLIKIWIAERLEKEFAA